MTKIQYKDYNQNDFLLFPPCIGDFVPENHPVRTVNAILDNLDISEIESTYKGGGTTSYHPRMLLKVIVYALFDQHLFRTAHGISVGGERVPHVVERDEPSRLRDNQPLQEREAR